MNRPPANTDAYIRTFPPATQKLLNQMRACIRKAAPKAVETISYGIPTFKLDGMLVSFAGYKNHIGFYPGAAAIAAFQNRFVGLKISKGTVQFPLDKKIPLSLVDEVVRFRVKANTEKALMKSMTRAADKKGLR